ncbi:unnamed protein product [Arabidopsis halleri]
MSLACDLVVSSRKWRCDCPLITTFIWFDDEHEEQRNNDCRGMGLVFSQVLASCTAE